MRGLGPTGLAEVRCLDYQRAGEAQCDLENAPRPLDHKQLQLRAHDRALQVLAWRLGIDGEQRTLEAIGAALGVTRERVRQIEVRGRRRLFSLNGRPLTDDEIRQQFESTAAG